MKMYMIYSFVFFHLVSGISLLFAQSDYETVQNFKQRTAQIENVIKNAGSLDELMEAEENIEQMKNDFINYKELLDKSLYPDNFTTSIEKLRNSLLVRKKDFSQVDTLRTEVEELKGQVDVLSQRNNELVSQFERLEAQSKDDRVRVVQLEKTVAKLKESLKKRDQIVLSMIDSLLPASYREKENLTAAEKQKIFTGIEKGNVLYNVKKAIDDNIRFIESTRLHAKDLGEIKDQQKVFAKVWRGAGPAMVEVYSDKGRGLNELKEIDEAFTEWHEKVELEAWKSINDKFEERDVNLKHFSSGTEFTSAVRSFVNYEISNVNSKGDRDAIIAYKNFAEKIWHNDLEEEWIPFLLDYEILADVQKDSIEIMLASWRDTVYPGGVNWILVVVGVVIVSILTVLYTRWSANKKKKNTVAVK